jgi:hypothetical protein
MKAYRGVEHSSSQSLTSALDAGEWSDSRPGRFTSRERAPGTHWLGGLVGPRAGLDSNKRYRKENTALFSALYKHSTCSY